MHPPNAYVTNACRPRVTQRISGRVYCFVSSLVSTKSEEDAQDVCSKVVLVCFMALAALTASLMTAMYLWIKLPISAAIAGADTLLFSAAVAHVMHTKKSYFVSWVMKYAFCGSALLAHWALGNNVLALGVLCAAFIGPQVSLITSRSIGPPIIVHVFSICYVAVMVVVELLVGEGNFTPQVFQPSKGWQIVLTTVVMVTGASVSVVALSFVVSKLRAQATQLEGSIAKAEALACKIAAFDVNDVPEDDLDCSIVNLMLKIARTMRLYRPYIPAHLLLHDVGFESPDASDQQSCGVPEPFTPRTQSYLPSSPGTPSGGGSLKSYRSTISIDPGVQAKFNQRIQQRVCTLLYVQVGDAEGLTATANSQTLEVFEECAAAFAHLVITTTAESKGFMQSLSYNRCLISWNLACKVNCHVSHALSAAILIRDQFKQQAEKQDFVSSNISMGLWTGCLTFGTIGTKLYKTFAFCGEGVTRVCATMQTGSQHLSKPAHHLLDLW